MFRFRQPIDRTAVADPYGETRREMRRIHVEADRTVAVTASSRGIADIVPITRGVVDHFTELGARPFLVPAMGSHAGGTAESQEQLLADYGLTESLLGCPIRSSMETVVFGDLTVENDGGPLTCPVHFDRLAAGADHVFLVNRIKSHTRFTGPIESGLLKMLMIGLGNAHGAAAYHRAVGDDRFPVVIRQVAEHLVRHVSVLGGLGIVENGLGKTARLRALPMSEIPAEEEKLLVLSKRLMPRIPFDEIDLLFVEQIGKNISGTGMDSNVVGRKFDDHKAVKDEKPRIRCIAVLGLTPESAGNANGIGMAEFCLRSVLQEIDWKKTRLNAMTAGHVAAAMVPLDFETESEILEAARLSLGLSDASALRVVRIRDTLHLEEIAASESLRSEVLRQGFEMVEYQNGFNYSPLPRAGEG